MAGSTSTHSNTRPRHIAIVMDGNGRWATRRLLPRQIGHRQGVKALRACIKAAIERDVEVLTVFAFSSENWRRPPDEIEHLMALLVGALEQEVPELIEYGVRLHFPGNIAALSPEVQAAIANATTQTAQGQRLVLNVCLNYGGRWDMVDTAARLVAAGLPLTEDNFSRHHALSHVVDLDLFIRTGGEQRLSNFLLWQSAYAELYFSDKLWPDFDAAELDLALSTFAQRERRFGQV